MEGQELKDFIIDVDMPKLKIASILDIAVMKIIAIGGRGAKKDFQKNLKFMMHKLIYVDK